MESDRSQTENRTLADYVAVVRRRKWVAIVPLVVVPAAALLYSAQQQARYEAKAEVWISRQNVATSLTGIANPDVNTEPSRFTETQADLARVPQVLTTAVKRSGIPGVTPRALLENSSVTPHSNSDILTFKVKNSAPLRAAKLATAYAHAFSDYRLQLATASFATAREDLEANLQRLRKKGLTETQLYRELEQRSQELRTLELLQTKPAVVREATDAAKVAPAPIRTASFGLAFGLLLGIAAAFLWNALDRRVRDESEVEAALGIPLLARLSSAHRSRGLVMLDKPSDIEAEAVRRLRAGLEFANLDLKAKVIMVGSAVAEEGKSVTLANLAVALARSGRSVALVDLDLRRPSIGRLFGIRSGYGLTDVALGRVALDNALVKIPLGVGRQQEAKLSFRTAHSDVGELFALESGEVPPNPSELIGTSVVRDIVTALRERMDYVLVDAPPVLAVSDASILSSLVDAIIVVVRLGRVNSSDLHELARELRGSPAPMLGFIITGSSPGDFYSGYEYAESSEVSNGARGVRRLASALPSLEAPDPKQVAEEREGRSWA